MTDVPAPALFLFGPRAVGKSAVGFGVFADLISAGMAAAYVDLAQLGFAHPAPADDPDNHRLKARNLAAVWSTYQSAGARFLVVTGIATTSSDLRRYTDAIPNSTMITCRLRASHSELHARVRRRSAGEGPPIPGDDLLGLTPSQIDHIAANATESSTTLDRLALGDQTLNTDDRSVADLTATIRTTWPHPTATPPAPAPTPASGT